MNILPKCVYDVTTYYFTRVMDKFLWFLIKIGVDVEYILQKYVTNLHYYIWIKVL